MTSVFGNCFLFEVLKILKIHAINFKENEIQYKYVNTNMSFQFHRFKSMKLLFIVFRHERKNIELLVN